MALLLAHSHYSLLTAPSAPRALCEEAVRLGHDHLVLTDIDGLYGFLPFAREARRVGLHAIFGVELTHGPRRLWAIARDRNGYRSLCRLVSARHLHHDFDLATAAAHHSEGLTFLANDPALLLDLHGRVEVYAWEAGSISPSSYTSPVRTTVPRKAADPAPPIERARIREAAAVLDLPLVAVWPVWFARANDHAAHLLFMAVKWSKSLAADATLRGHVTAAPHMHVPDQATLAAAFADQPQALANARTLRRDCTLVLGDAAPPIFPDYELPAGETAPSYLRALTERGLGRRYPAWNDTLRQRMERELAVIEQMGFAPYFLVVREIAELAKQRGIPCVGRGSAADSLVAYGLGLTDADPIRYGLLFERFLNPARRDLPDIDLDFCWRRRDELLDAVYQRFGRDRVAMIATYNTFAARAAYREAAKAAGLPPKEVDRRSHLLPFAMSRDASKGFAQMVASTPGFWRNGIRLDAAREQAIVEGAALLLDAPRHLGIHCGGIVVTPGPIAEHAPLERAAKGLVVTQYDMHFVEGLGLVKIDLLGNRALTILQDGGALLQRNGIAAPDLHTIPEDDAATARLLQHGRTLGCFQSESPGMRALLRQLRAADMDRVIQAVALIRPGPAAVGMKDVFVRRLRGLEPVRCAHPVLEPMFRDTFGLMLYQEDLILATMAVAGYSAADADQVRRHLSKAQWQHNGGHDAVKDAFVVAGLRQGLTTTALEEIWQDMTRFAGFTFCKAHAATYGRISYRCAYLKAHHPAAFLAALLSNDAGYYDKGVYVEDAKRHGIAVLPPCVNRGEVAYTLAAAAASGEGSGFAIRVGLMEVHGLGSRTLAAIADARRLGGPFGSVEEFLARTEAGRDETEKLILCGAFDVLGRTRPEQLWRLRLATDRTARSTPRAPVLIPGALAPKDVAIPALPEYDAARRTSLELAILGFALGRHAVDVLWSDAKPNGTVPCARAEELVGKQITIYGWVVAMRRWHTKKGEPLIFFTIEDGTGILECTLFPDVYARLAGLLQGRGPYLVGGRMESQMDGLSLTVRTLRAVGE